MKHHKMRRYWTVFASFLNECLQFHLLLPANESQNKQIHSDYHVHYQLIFEAISKKKGEELVQIFDSIPKWLGSIAITKENG